MTKFALVLLIVLDAAQAFAQEKNFYRLRPEALECIVENVEIYRGMGDLIYVDALKCPPEGEVSILDNLVNEIPNPEYSEDYDSFLVLTASNLDCLSNVTPLETVEAYRFYPDQCRLEAE